MSNFVNKLKNWVAGDGFDEDDYLMDDDYTGTSSMDTASSRGRGDYGGSSATTGPVREELSANSSLPVKKSLKVVEHPAAAMLAEVVIIEPRQFNEALSIIDHLKARKAVILNLHLLDTAQSQRVVDFLSGATHALEGHQQRIGDGVFIFTPITMTLSSETVTARDEGLSLSDAYWNTPR